MELEIEPEAGLALRTTPQQDRAKATVERILDAASILVEEAGIDAFTTNRLADRCSVRVRSVYRYFPNKHAIIAALYQRLTESWRSFFEDGFARMADPRLNWRVECDELIGDFVELLENHRGAVAIRKAMKAEPGLIVIERADNDFLSRRFAGIMMARVDGAESRDLARVGRTWLNAISILVDLALEAGPAERNLQLEEARRMQRAYLGTYLD